MKAMYGKVYNMSKSEAFVVLAISFAVVIAYSVWGAYLIHAPAAGSGTSPQVATTSK